MRAGMKLVARRIDRAARRAALAAKRQRKPSAAELVRRFRLKEQEKTENQKTI